MKEKDIVWEGGNLWVGRVSKDKYVLFRVGNVCSLGFLQFTEAEKAIRNGRALAGRLDLVDRLCS